MKGQLRINQLFAFVLVDDDGTEGVPAFGDGRGVLMPLMGADMARVDSLKQLVATDPMFRGRRITLLRFGHRETIGVIDRTSETSVVSEDAGAVGSSAARPSGPDQRRGGDREKGTSSS